MKCSEFQEEENVFRAHSAFVVASHHVNRANIALVIFHYDSDREQLHKSKSLI